MNDLSKQQGSRAFLVRLDGTDHVVIAANLHDAVKAAFAWWRSDPECATDDDDEIPLDRVEPIAEHGAIIVMDLPDIRGLGFDGLGVDGIRDPEAPCRVFVRGDRRKDAGCRGDGHFLCRECACLEVAAVDGK